MDTKITAVELVKLVSAIGDVASIADTVFADGVVNVGDIGRLPALLRSLKEFADVGYADLIPEVTDLTADEAAQVEAAFKQHFNLSNDTLEANIESGADIVVQVLGAVQTLKGFVDALRGKAKA